MAATGTQGNVSRMRRRGRGASVSPRAYLDEAERLLERSRLAPEGGDAVVFAYRAACRAAGALIETARETSSGRLRRMPPGSAWSRLRALVPEKAGWADRFEVHARFTNRVEMGLEHGVGAAAVEAVYADACLLVDEARGDCGYLPVVA